MARIRKFVSYRRIERPYTRKSKVTKKNYVRAVPVSKLVRYNMGNQRGKFAYMLRLTSKEDIQIRHNALESARQTSNKVMETKVGANDYYLQVRPYPHHVLRENPLASGAGADRMSTGMQKAFGKAISVAARVFKGDTIISVLCNEQHLPQAKIALKRAYMKLPGQYQIVVQKRAAV